MNLDPAAEEFEFEPDIDIKDLISLEDVMEEMGLGPNGGLMACFEYSNPPSAFPSPLMSHLGPTTLKQS